jgi:small ligand-binding sensory domain FIST
MDDEDRELAQQGSLFLGIVADEMRLRYLSGDFIVRDLIGVDPEEGVIAISEQIEIGQTVQFHLRDAATARQELRRLLHQYRQSQVIMPAGGLLFNCVGRGKALYGSAHHDIRTIRAIGGDFPVGGLFCNGEIGPLGDFNCIHGYTASLGFFRPAKIGLPKKKALKPLGQTE